MTSLKIDHRNYNVDIHQRQNLPEDAPRLVVAAFQPNQAARDILYTCIRAIQKFTPVPYELWVIDNHSPHPYADELLDFTDINVVLNYTDPEFPVTRSPLKYLKAKLRGQSRHPYSASYANAIALEIAVRLIPSRSKYFMSMHMDTLPCHGGWLNFLLSKLVGNVAAAGFQMNTLRIPDGTLHILGCLIDFQRFRELDLTFLPNLPKFDTGDKITTELRQAGLCVYVCKNTFNQPHLIETIPQSSPFRNLPVVRAFDDSENIIFLHLGRGIKRATGHLERGVSPEEWNKFARKHVINND